MTECGVNKMLDKLFTYVLDLTVPASIVILLVMLLRLMLKGQKKIWSYALWLVVLLRLVLPAGVALPLNGLEVPAFTSRYTLSDAQIAWPDAGEALVESLSGSPAVSVEGAVDGVVQRIPCAPWEIYVLVGKYLWLAGVIVMVAVALVRYWRLRKNLRKAVLLRDNIYALGSIPTPFVLGLLYPRIYLPSGLTEQEEQSILLHEQHHIRRDDHVFRVVAFLVLCLHWFNPLVWAAFILSGRDMEMSCDEAVVRHMSGDQRADYAQCLLRCAARKAHIAGMPLAFSEGDTGKRIRNLANWKKPVLWICIAAVILSLPLVFLRPAAAAEPAEKVELSVGASFTMPEYPSIHFVVQGIEFSRVTVPCLMYEQEGKAYFPFGKLGSVRTVYLADLNGDGCREICGAFMAGGPLVIWVYDLRTHKKYMLRKTEGYNGLTIKDGCLVVLESSSHAATYTAGRLLLVKEKLMCITENGVYVGKVIGTDNE